MEKKKSFLAVILQEKSYCFNIFSSFFQKHAIYSLGRSFQKKKKKDLSNTHVYFFSAGMPGHRLMQSVKLHYQNVVERFASTFILITSCFYFDSLSSLVPSQVFLPPLGFSDFGDYSPVTRCLSCPR